MPNWCSNYIYLKGPKEKIQELWGKIEEQNVFLEVLVPLGEWTFGNSVSSWGTKWDVDTEGLELDFDEEDELAEIYGWFDSAWSPPTEAYETFLTNNPDFSIEATFYESGLSFIGSWKNFEELTFEDVEELLREGCKTPEFLELIEEYGVELWEEEEALDTDE